MAQFQVIQTWKTGDAFIIKGILLEGQIRNGMEIYVAFNSSLQMTGSIMDIKKINELYHISIGCSDKDEIELWEMLNLNGNVLKIC
ncbi:hypothetical protein [Paenibacillus harenae]|uniref:hypothetical protein n=1 Tax=Paenibacillus harenae TaxID=306543 RepID=UPI00041F3458|nr:hypothetical protein [Paenibacillus harenae]